MGRSVSTHRYAVATAYITFSCESEYDVQEEFNSLIEDVQNVVQEKYPAFQPCDRWQDREDHVVLESRCAEVSISEYNGIVAVCIAPLDVDKPLHVAWCEQVADNFRAHIAKRYPSTSLVSQGTFSNGEQCFALKAEPGSCVTGKEGRLW